MLLPNDGRRVLDDLAQPDRLDRVAPEETAVEWVGLREMESHVELMRQIYARPEYAGHVVGAGHMQPLLQDRVEPAHATAVDGREGAKSFTQLIEMVLNS